MNDILKFVKSIKKNNVIVYKNNIKNYAKSINLTNEKEKDVTELEENSNLQP